MAGSTKSTVATDVDLDSVRNDVRSLRSEFEMFLHDLKSGTFGYVAGATDRGVNAVAEHVREKPLSSILIAFGVGVLSRRFLFR